MDAALALRSKRAPGASLVARRIRAVTMEVRVSVVAAEFDGIRAVPKDRDATQKVKEARGLAIEPG